MVSNVHCFHWLRSLFNVFVQILRWIRLKLDPWRNGSASDSRSEGCVFDSRRVQVFSNFFGLNFRVFFCYCFCFFEISFN